MALIDHPTAETTTDAEAIDGLHEAVARQKAAFLADPFPSLEERQQLLGALAGMMMGHRTQIQEALSSDFGVHPTLASDLIECLGVAGRAVYAAENLGQWMEPEDRHAEPAFFGSARAYVQQQPKGVVGNIVPWNFPFDLSVGPLIEMLAAGNRVIIKPSEYTPACGEVLRDMIRATFDRDRVDVVVGGLELAKAFTGVRWDHLLYTGSPSVGREIAKAAAEQLVPVTLELGGKCPAILTEDSVDAESVKQILGTKAIKNGQMCISVDYCLVPRAQVEEFASLCETHVRENMPGYCASESCTGIITERHLERLRSMLGEAREAGSRRAAARGPGRGRRPARGTPDADLARRRPARGARDHARGDLRPDPPDRRLRRARRRDRPGQRGRAPARALRVLRRRGHGERRPAPDHVGRRMREHRGRPRCAGRRCRSAASARAARAATTGSRASASSPTRVACSCAAARAT